VPSKNAHHELQGGPIIREPLLLSLNRIENPPIRIDFEIEFEYKRSTEIISFVYAG